jgi:multisubunit Na+/H+ antiporter MnhG subunit
MLKELIEEIIEAQGNSGIRVFNQIRLTLTLIGPLFVISGLGGLIGFGEFYTNGKVDEGTNHYISSAIFIIIGIISLILRLTIFRDKKTIE